MKSMESLKIENKNELFSIHLSIHGELRSASTKFQIETKLSVMVVYQ